MGFTRQDEGTQEDWDIIKVETGKIVAQMPDRILELLRSLKDVTGGFVCDQLHHSLMTATLAEEDGASDEEIIISLCHDIGKAIAIPNHGPIAAELLRPYVSDHAYHALYNHQHFQGKFYYEFLGLNPNMRDDFKDEPWYDMAERFVDKWDNPAFDPDYPVKPLEHFEPLVRKTFARPLPRA